MAASSARISNHTQNRLSFSPISRYPFSMFIWAHRGASADAPENTLVAFAAALESGADGIELDVHLSADGTAVVLHDTTITRTSNGRGRVAKTRDADLKNLDFGSWFSPEFAGEPIPTLAEVFDLVGNRMRINVEIKSTESAEAAMTLLRQFPKVEAIVSSFNLRLLDRLAPTYPQLPLGYLHERFSWRNALARAVAAKAESFHPRIDLLHIEMINTCHAQGIKIVPWVVDDPAHARNLQQQGVDGLFTNRPALMTTSLRG